MAQVTQSMTAGLYCSDQSDVWADIAEKSARLKSTSPTGAMEALFVDHSAFIDECVASLGPVELQIGAVFVIGSRVVGMDLFDAPSTLPRLLPKLVRAVAVDALDADVRPGDTKASTDQPSVESFLAAALEASVRESPAVGVGTDLRFTAPGLTGAALVDDGRVVHLSAFTM